MSTKVSGGENRLNRLQAFRAIHSACMCALFLTSHPPLALMYVKGNEKQRQSERKLKILIIVPDGKETELNRVAPGVKSFDPRVL